MNTLYSFIHDPFFPSDKLMCVTVSHDLHNENFQSTNLTSLLEENRMAYGMFLNH